MCVCVSVCVGDIDTCVCVGGWVGVWVGVIDIKKEQGLSDFCIFGSFNFIQPPNLPLLFVHKVTRVIDGKEYFCF